MPYRIFAVLIVGFWLVMSALLFRLEVHPENTNLLAVPVSYVLKLMFLQSQPSNLNIFEGGQQVGGLSIRPSVARDKSARSIAFGGNVSFHLPLMERQRVTWDGVLDLDRALAMTGLKFSVALRDLGYNTVVSIDPRKNRASYNVTQNGRGIVQSSLPLDATGVSMALMQLRVDPIVMNNLPTNLAAPAMTARQSELKIRNEKIEAYQITVKQDDSVVVDIYVSQLGQILLAKTPFGFTLSAEDISF